MEGTLMLEVRLYPETVECMVVVSYNMQEGCKLFMQVVQHLLIIVLSSSWLCSGTPVVLASLVYLGTRL